MLLSFNFGHSLCGICLPFTSLTHLRPHASIPWRSPARPGLLQPPPSLSVTCHGGSDCPRGRPRPMLPVARAPVIPAARRSCEVALQLSAVAVTPGTPMWSPVGDRRVRQGAGGLVCPTALMKDREGFLRVGSLPLEGPLPKSSTASP